MQKSSREHEGEFEIQILYILNGHRKASQRITSLWTHNADLCITNVISCCSWAVGLKKQKKPSVTLSKKVVESTVHIQDCPYAPVYELFNIMIQQRKVIKFSFRTSLVASLLLINHTCRWCFSFKDVFLTSWITFLHKNRAGRLFNGTGTALAC